MKESAAENQRGKSSLPNILRQDIAALKERAIELEGRKRRLATTSDPVDQRVESVRIDVEAENLRRSNEVLGRLVKRIC